MIEVYFILLCLVFYLKYKERDLNYLVLECLKCSRMGYYVWFLGKILKVGVVIFGKCVCGGGGVDFVGIGIVVLNSF